MSVTRAVSTARTLSLLGHTGLTLLLPPRVLARLFQVADQVTAELVGASLAMWEDITEEAAS